MNRRIEELHPHPKNTTIYGDEHLPDDFLESIRTGGILEPLAVKADGTIISGHRRFRGAKMLGLETVPVRLVVFDSEIDEVEAMLDHNKYRAKTFSQKMREADDLWRRRCP